MNARFGYLRSNDGFERDFFAPYRPTLNALNLGRSLELTQAEKAEIEEFLFDTLINDPVRGVRHKKGFTRECAFGYMKHVVDRLVLEGVFNALGVDKFTLQLGSVNGPDYDQMRRRLLEKGETVVSRLYPLGVKISTPSRRTPIHLPLNYRATAFDIAAGACDLVTGQFRPELNRVSKVVVTAGGLGTLHRLFQLICWKQTGKLSSDTTLKAYYKGVDALHPDDGFVLKAMKTLAEERFISPQDLGLLEFYPLDN
jgi:hypothetical protein